MKAFKNDGSLIASYNHPVATQDTLTLTQKDPLKLFIVQSYKKIYRFKLQDSAGVFTISTDSIVRDTSLDNPTNNYRLAVEKPGTNYIFYAFSGLGAKPLRYDCLLDTTAYSPSYTVTDA